MITNCNIIILRIKILNVNHFIGTLSKIKTPYKYQLKYLCTEMLKTF